MLSPSFLPVDVQLATQLSAHLSMHLSTPWAWAFQLAMLFCSLFGFGLSLWLGWYARFHAYLQPLSLFSALMALWCFGHMALQYDFTFAGKSLILLSPLLPTAFLQFVMQFIEPTSQRLNRILHSMMPLLWLCSLVVVLLSWSRPSGHAQLVDQQLQLFVFEQFGWWVLAYTLALGALSHWVLLQARPRLSKQKQHSAAALQWTGMWGLILASSFVLPSFVVDLLPYPMLLLPSYLLLLIYSVVRYQMLAVNAVARQALLYVVMALLLLLFMGLISAIFGQLGMPALAAVPDWQLWLYSSVLLVAAAACYQPVARLASRLIYPGVQLTETRLTQWQQQLAQAHDWQHLASQAAQLLAVPLQQPVTVCITPYTDTERQPSEVIRATAPALPRMQAATELQLTLSCHAGQWRTQLPSSHELTPSLQLVLDVFASLLCSRALSLQQSLALADIHAQNEAQRLSQQHLVELGALAASMAHELRNPLNIISMASATVDAELRQHIQQQLKRADRLIADMLVYAGRLELQLQTVPLHALVHSLVTQFDWQQVQIQLEIPTDLHLQVDPHRLSQVFYNLLDNAHAFLRNQAHATLYIAAQQAEQGCTIEFANNGPRLDRAVASALFQPFVSKRPGGSGLGLAIVRRIMQAHDGDIGFISSAEWPVCFQLWLPSHRLGPSADSTKVSP